MRPESPASGQESVWDYPRPPRVERSDEHVVIELGGARIADTRSALRVLETSHPPTYYLPTAAFTPGALRAATGSSYCEWKGTASYLDVLGGGIVAARQAWFYPEPSVGFEALTDHVAVYPAAMDRCLVDDETVVAQAGGFYGGWITPRVAGRSRANPAPPAGDPLSADRGCRDHRGTTPAAARTSSGPLRSGSPTKTVLTPMSGSRA